MCTWQLVVITGCPRLLTDEYIICVVCLSSLLLVELLDFLI